MCYIGCELSITANLYMAKARPINLLPQEEFEASVFGRILRWAMGTFRIIVIVTEVVVMAAFLSRFWLDAQNSDLTDQIKVDAAEISAQADFEKEFRGVQTKLKLYKDVSTSDQSSKKVDLISSKVPGDIVISSISVSSTTSELKGTSGSESSIAQFISNLKAEPTFKKVILGGISSSETNQSAITFTMEITY